MQKARRILIISNYFAPDAGAAAVRLTRLAHDFVQMGHKVTVLTSMPHYPQGKIHEGYRGRWAKVETRQGLRVVQVWLWATNSPRISRKLISQLSFMLMAMLRGVTLNKPDVILIEAQPVFTGLAGFFIARFKRRPYVLNISDLWPDHLLAVGALEESNSIYRAARHVVNFMYKRAKAIITMSPAWETRIRRHIAQPPPIYTILNGVDLERFQPALDVQEFRAQHDLQASKLVVFIGTFATQYNFDLMIDMAAAIQKREDVQVLFIGQGSQSSLLESRLKEPDLAGVRWVPWLAHSDIPVAWNSAYLTFWAMGEHPLYEGTIPAKMFEAMACGVPMAIYARGVIQDIISRSGAGVVVSDGGLAAWGAAIEKILDDVDLRSRMAKQARDYAEAHFYHRHVSERYASVLQEAST